MSSSADAMNMGNARRKRGATASGFVPDVGEVFRKMGNVTGVCVRRHLCRLRQENDVRFDGHDSGKVVSAVLVPIF
jgi:hypothetical protein